jgi:clan AA aspartic protease
MGSVYTDIILKNGSDLIRLQDGNIKEKDVRSITVNAIVDTGALTLVINEDIRQELGLSIEGSRTVNLADGKPSSCKVTEPVHIYWENRDAACRAWVLPEAKKVLLGVIPLEEMDLAVDPVNQKLFKINGDEISGFIY